MISCKILADSINPVGSRLTSCLWTYPRFIHSEVMTHRAFSRNAASSRARPFRKMVEAVELEPAFPEHWGAEQRGMQSADRTIGKDWCKEVWREALNNAATAARTLHSADLHKSICNRLLEPFAHMTTLVTATDKGFANFFALRAHPAAQPEFQVLAYRMLSQYLANQPNQLQWGAWHYPVFKAFELLDSEASHVITQDEWLKIATARCARLSYLTHDGEHSTEKDIELHDRLLESRHLSPFEHCAQANQNRSLTLPPSNFDADGIWCGWLQYRKMISGENQTDVDLNAIMATKPDWITI